MSWQPVEASTVFLRGLLCHRKNPDIIKVCVIPSQTTMPYRQIHCQVKYATSFQEGRKEAGTMPTGRGNVWRRIFYKYHQAFCRLQVFHATPTLSLSISLPASVFVLPTARGIWSCHSDNALRPTRKQTAQKAFGLLMTDAKMFYFFLFGGDKQKEQCTQGGDESWSKSFCAVSQRLYSLWSDWQLQSSFSLTNPKMYQTAEQNAVRVVFKMTRWLLLVWRGFNIQGSFTLQL